MSNIPPAQELTRSQRQDTHDDDDSAIDIQSLFVWLLITSVKLATASLNTGWILTEKSCINLTTSVLLKHLSYSLFSIVEKHAVQVAAYAAKTDKQRIYLHMLLVVSEHQTHSAGSHILDLLKDLASASDLPIELSIIPVNPVAEFYQKNGITMIEATDDKKVFRWIPE